MATSRRRVGRRGFLKGAAVGAAGLVTPTVAAAAHTGTQQAAPAGPAPASPAPERVEVFHTDRPGADFMVDVLKSLGFEYVAANPGSTFRALHESLINYGGNTAPELLTCCHEESSVAMAHGYAKIEGKPMMVMAHGTVGLQHASMAIYNAYADRVPVYIVIGNILDVQCRRSDVEWTHAVQDAAAMVRDYTKWDDTPVSLTHFGESAVRAFKMAMTPPYGPVVLVADATLQEEPIRGRRADPPARAEADADLAAGGRSRRGDRTGADAGGRGEPAHHRRPRGAHAAGRVALLVELAELLQAPVQDMRFTLRMNFPSRHPLKLGPAVPVTDADVILGLEHPEFFQNLHAQTPTNRMGMESRPNFKPGTKIATISSSELLTKSNYQDVGRYIEVDLTIPADAEATLPALIEACRTLDHAGAPARLRGARRARGGRDAPRRSEQALEQAAYGLGRQPDLDGAAVGRAVEPDQGRRLVARLGRVVHQQLAAPAVGLHQALPVHRLVGRLRHRLRRARRGRRRARQSQARTAEREHPVRRRPELRAGRAVDGRAPSHPAAHGDAQQPRLSPGADVHRRHGDPRQPRRRAAPASATTSRTPTSTTRRWPRPTACMASARSPTLPISARRSSARSRS